MSTDQISRGTGENSRGASMGKSLAALDGLNFFLADVQSGLGPFLGIYLLTVPGWNPGGIGLVLTIGGIVGLFVQTPAGALIDRTRHKRTLIIIAALATSAGAYMITVKPSSYAVVTTAQVVIGVAGVVFPRRSPRSRSGWSARAPTPTEPGGCRRSTTPATSWVRWPTVLSHI